MNKRTLNSQFEIMLDFFEAHPQMLSGKIDPFFSKEEKEKRWEELASALNAEGQGPAKSIALWRKTLKDWKCYVKKKAARIALRRKQAGDGPPSKEELTSTEERLLLAISEVAAYEQSTMGESTIYGDLVPFMKKDISEFQETNEQNYCDNRKAIKRKIEQSLAAEVSQKLISSQKETNKSQRRLVDIAENKINLLEDKLLILQRKVKVAGMKAAAVKHSVVLEERRQRQEWRKQSHDLRMKKLHYL